ncbi:subtilase family protein [Yoonia maricola]|uniref:Subtilase family protein n=1 Tax=Yoonia maricola TaxID=420999 RepID=A0A2M8W516_9RHOB|nr:S8 family peptidase [Yoonia maricola]PJI85996.1 subtilase family protein [Yoonia maricola]
MASRYHLPHQVISGRHTNDRYQAHTFPRTKREFDREAYSNELLAQLKQGAQKFKDGAPIEPKLGSPDGVFLEVTLNSSNSVTEVLQKNKMQVGATKILPNGDRVVGLYVPTKSMNALEGLLHAYGYGDLGKTGDPPNSGRVEAINSFRAANFLSFWNDDRFRLPDDENTPIWWEVWCAPEHETDLEKMCATMGLEMGAHENRLRFPESVVVPVLASKINIELVLFAKFTIQELRRSDDTPEFYLEDNDVDEQLEWVDDLAQKVKWPDVNVPYISVLDTGVNRAHDLLEAALSVSDLFAVKPQWGGDDTGHRALSSHGTQMASVALHGDLTHLLSTTSPVVLQHRVESVKLVPPPSFPENPEEKLGCLTESAVLDPEAASPDRRRIHCLAVSNKDRAGSQPSPWSSAIDRLAAGAVNPSDETEPKRLFVVSSGNTDGSIQHFDEVVGPTQSPVLDPAQSWNALSVGGVTFKVEIQGPNTEEMYPLAKAGELSPHTRTTVDWDESRTPYKPEVVFEAGNKAVGKDGYVVQMNSLDLLAAGRDMTHKPLAAFRATSAATALAARAAAVVTTRNPELWPETVRGLLVHSAEWTEPMRKEFEAVGDYKAQAKLLLRRFGYGVPDIERACASASNHVTLIAQEQIQPFVTGKMGYCHVFDLPWPKAVIESLPGDTELEVKVTLSYFIEPNPGRSASIYPNRYQSHGLRFDLRRKEETVSGFLEQTNALKKQGKQKPKREPDEGWVFGSTAVSAGSLHCDVWRGDAAKLLTRDMICVYPVAGWWKSSKIPGKNSQMARYALIVSIKSPSLEIDLHTPISAIVSPEIETTVKSEVEAFIDTEVGNEK